MAQKMTVKKAISLLLMTFLAILFAGALYLSFVPIDLTAYKPRLEAYIRQSSGRDISIERIYVKAFPSPRFTIISAKLNHDNSTVIDIKRLELEVALFPLIYGNTVIDELKIGRADLYVKRNANGVVNIKELAGKKENGGLKINYAEIDDGWIHVTDEFPEIDARFMISGIKAKLTRSGDLFAYEASGSLAPGSPFGISGNLKLENGKAIFRGKGNVNTFELARLTPYMNMLRTKAMLAGTVNAKIDYDWGEKGSVEGNLSYQDLRVSIPRFFRETLASPSGDAEFAIYRDKHTDISIEKANIEMDKFDIKGSFKLTGNAEERKLEITASSSPIPSEAVMANFPVRAFRPKSIARLDSFAPRGGTIKLNEFKLEAPLEVLRQKRLFRTPGAIVFDATVNDVDFKYMGMRENFHDVSGRVEYRGNTLSVEGLNAKYDESVIRKFNGTLSDIPKPGNKAYTANLDALLEAGGLIEMAREVTSEPVFRRTTDFSRKLEKAKAAGPLDIDLRLEGRLKKGEKKVTGYSGKVAFDKNKLSYAGFPLGVESVSGSVSFDKEKIEARDMAATDGASTLKLAGTLTRLKDGTRHADVKAQGELAGPTLNALANARSMDFGSEGKIPFSITAKGPSTGIDLDASISLTPAYLRFRNIIEKASGFPVEFKASLKAAESSISIKKASLDFGRSSISASGSFYREPRAFDLILRSGKMMIEDIDDITPYISKDFASSGDLSFSVQSIKEEGKSPAYKGSARLVNGSFTSPRLGKPVNNLNASARFDGNKARAEISSINIGNSEIKGTVELTDIAARKIKFDLSSPRFTLEDIFAQKAEKTPEPPPGRKNPVTGNGVIKIENGSARNQTFSNLSAEVWIDAGKVRFEPFSFTKSEGLVSGKLTLYTDTANPIQMETDFKLENISMEPLLIGFNVKQKLLTGRLNGTVNLTKTRSEDAFGRGIDGRVSLVTRKGKLWKGLVLNKIFSIVNIVSIDALLREGMPYDRITGDFDINNGVISTDNLDFRSDSMRMSLIGQVDTVEKTMDARLGMHPFVTIDKIISQIPLAGWILTGKDERSVSLFFRLDGPVNDPDIRPIPAKSIEKSVIEIFERLLKAPFKLFD